VVVVATVVVVAPVVVAIAAVVEVAATLVVLSMAVVAALVATGALVVENFGDRDFLLISSGPVGAWLAATKSANASEAAHDASATRRAMPLRKARET
jgi:hypothetical protein